MSSISTKLEFVISAIQRVEHYIGLSSDTGVNTISGKVNQIHIPYYEEVDVDSDGNFATTYTPLQIGNSYFHNGIVNIKYKLDSDNIGIDFYDDIIKTETGWQINNILQRYDFTTTKVKITYYKSINEEL